MDGCSADIFGFGNGSNVGSGGSYKIGLEVTQKLLSEHFVHMGTSFLVGEVISGL